MTSRPLRIAHVITGLTTGGAERMLSKVSSAMTPMGVSSTVLAGFGGNIERELREAGTVSYIIRRKSSSVPDAPSLVPFLRRCASGDFDGFVGWMYHGNLLASLLGAAFRRPVVWSIRQSLGNEPLDKPLTRLLIRAGAAVSRAPKAIIYNSHAAAAAHRARGYAAENEVVIPNGFDSAAFFPDEAAAASFRARHGLSSEDKLVGFVGRNHPAKDLPTFVRMAKHVWQHRKDARFLLVLGGVAAERSPLEQLIAETGCSDRFLILDEMADLRGVYSAMRVFCLTSKSEAFPNVLGEAMFCGVPCVTTNVGDAAGVVGEHGWIAQPTDAEALAAGVVSILSMEPDQYRVLSEIVRERAVSLYSLDRIAAQYAAVFRDLMQVCH